MHHRPLTMLMLVLVGACSAPAPKRVDPHTTPADATAPNQSEPACGAQRVFMRAFTTAACVHEPSLYYWDGSTCVEVVRGPNCVTCEGLDCGDVFHELADCTRRYAGCKRAPHPSGGG